MKADKFDATGKKVGEVELPASVFLEEYSNAAIHQVVRIENRNRRQGTHKTKGFSEVRGGGKKPWRQKGTGNARQGSTRAPQWRGGGTVFGPVPRDYSLKLPVAIRKSGIRSILSARAKASAVAVIDDVAMADYSTKAAFNIFKTMGFIPGNTVVLVTDSEDERLKKSLSNIPNVDYMNSGRLTAPELLYAGQLVITSSALEKIEAQYNKSSRSKAGAV